MPTEPSRLDFLGLEFDRLDLGGALAWLRERTADQPFAYVVTPNVDHVLRIEATPALRPLYAGAALCLNDSRVLQKLARRARVPLPLAPGSDLTPAVLAAIAEAGDTIAIVGGEADVARRLTERYPNLRFRAHQPPMGLARDPVARRRVIDWMAHHPARFTLLAVGSPQQEMIAAEAAGVAAMRGTALCIGASIDFVLGVKARAPRFVQRLGFEWAWRLASEPRRLARRYLVDAPRIFPLARRWQVQRKELTHPQP